MPSLFKYVIIVHMLDPSAPPMPEKLKLHVEFSDPGACRDAIAPWSRWVNEKAPDHRGTWTARCGLAGRDA